MMKLRKTGTALGTGVRRVVPGIGVGIGVRMTPIGAVDRIFLPISQPSTS